MRFSSLAVSYLTYYSPRVDAAKTIDAVAHTVAAAAIEASARTAAAAVNAAVSPPPSTPPSQKKNINDKMNNLSGKKQKNSKPRTSYGSNESDGGGGSGSGSGEHGNGGGGGSDSNGGSEGNNNENYGNMDNDDELVEKLVGLVESFVGIGENNEEVLMIAKCVVGLGVIDRITDTKADLDVGGLFSTLNPTLNPTLSSQANAAAADSTTANREYVDEEGNGIDNPSYQSCAPKNFDNGTYNEANVEIWKLWLKFYEEVMKVETKTGVVIDLSQLCGPLLSWGLPRGKLLVFLMLRYEPTRIANMIGNLHPAAAKDETGSHISATWDLLSLSLGSDDQGESVFDEYCGKGNFWWFAYPYRGKPTDVYEQDDLDKLMVHWKKYIHGLFNITNIRVQLCSKGVETDIEKHIFDDNNLVQGDSQEARFRIYRDDLNQLFIIPCHPEMHLNDALIARFANGFLSICELHDTVYTEVRSALLGPSASPCTAGMDIYEEQGEAHQLRLQACADALARAIDMVKEASAIYRGETVKDEISDSIKNIIDNWEELKSMWKEGTNPLQLWALEQLKDAGIVDVSAYNAMKLLRINEWKDGISPLQLWAQKQLKDAGIDVSARDAIDRLWEEGISPLQLWAQKQCEELGMEDVTARDAMSRLMSCKWSKGTNSLQIHASKVLKQNEDLLGLRVDQLTPNEVWERYLQLCAFKAHLPTIEAHIRNGNCSVMIGNQRVFWIERKHDKLTYSYINNTLSTLDKQDWRFNNATVQKMNVGGGMWEQARNISHKTKVEEEMKVRIAAQEQGKAKLPSATIVSVPLEMAPQDMANQLMSAQLANKNAAKKKVGKKSKK